MDVKFCRFCADVLTEIWLVSLKHLAGKAGITEAPPLCSFCSGLFWWLAAFLRSLLWLSSDSGFVLSGIAPWLTVGVAPWLYWHCSVTLLALTLWSTRLQCSYATLTTSEFSSTMSSRRVQPVRACRNQQSTTNTVSLRFEFPARDSGISAVWI